MEIHDLRTGELVEIAPLDVLAVFSRASNMCFPAELIGTGGAVVLTHKHGTLWTDFIGMQRAFKALQQIGHIAADVRLGDIDEWRQVYHRETNNYGGVAKRIDDFSVGIGDRAVNYTRR